VKSGCRIVFQCKASSGRFDFFNHFFGQERADTFVDVLFRLMKEKRNVKTHSWLNKISLALSTYGRKYALEFIKSIFYRKKMPGIHFGIWVEVHFEFFGVIGVEKVDANRLFQIRALRRCPWLKEMPAVQQ
jgi:hypothetical protein